MYRVQYFCPRELNAWQDLMEGFIWRTPRQFPTQNQAQEACNMLLWRYHSARVIDPYGRVVYTI